MADQGTPFMYPPLPADVDALRTLTVAPGDFYDPLECSLISMAFSERPKYIALSYTWGASYPDMSNLPISPNDGRSSYTGADSARNLSMWPRPDSAQQHLAQSKLTSHRTTKGRDAASLQLNDQPFHVGRNLHLALLHLRSPMHPIIMWIDAICINQADTMERNRQVSLMSSIYTRAIGVIAWLGTKRYTSMAGIFRTMSLECKAGRTQHFVATVADGGKMRYSPKPAQGIIVRIAESTYWTRLWIVQEVCLPRLLALAYGSEIWTYEEFRQWGSQRIVHRGPQQSDVDTYGAIRRLLETRDMRHTNTMTLQSLIERFAKNNCSELRDRVYSLLGCANDIRPFVGSPGTGPINTGQQHQLERQRGVGSLKVDYSCSFYEIWTSIIDFAFFQATNVESHIPVKAYSEAQKHDTDKMMREERRISIVRTAGIVQSAFGQKIEEEFAHPGHVANKQDPSVIQVVGYIAGEIVRLGPGYNSLVGSSLAQQDWTRCWVGYYEKTEDLETLRRIEEEYAAKVLHCEERDVVRIRDIRDPHVTAWPVIWGSSRPGHSELTRRAAEYDAMWFDVSADKREPRMCLGTGHVIGLVPPSAKVGDIIVRFWNCDAAITMRPILPATTGTAAPPCMLVGRADVAEVVDRKATPGRDLHAEQCMSGATAPGFTESSRYKGAVYVDLSLKTLQEITAYITT